MLYHTIKQYILVLALAAFVSATVGLGNATASNQLPSYYPDTFVHTGLLSSIGSISEVVISGARYTLSPNVLIHTLSTEFGSKHSLRVGQEVGFSFTTNSRKISTITEIWLLPPGSINQL